MELVTHRPRKTGERNLVADRPWERGGLGPYSCVLQEGGIYKMWYHTMASKLWDSSPTAGSICYATSPDGIAWVRLPLADCGLIHTANEIDRTVTWKASADAGLPAGQPIRLRVEMRNADLYAFQFR